MRPLTTERIPVGRGDRSHSIASAAARIAGMYHSFGLSAVSVQVVAVTDDASGEPGWAIELSGPPEQVTDLRESIEAAIAAQLHLMTPTPGEA